MSGVGQSEDGVEASTSGMMETSMMEGEEYYNPDETGTWAQKEMSDQLCRICAKHNQYLIPIFEGEGIEHQLEPKIQKHLPIEVCESDDLPLQVCYQCASTLIAWNDLVIACIEADKKLRQIHEQEQEDEDEDNKGAEFFDEPILDSDEGEDPVEPSTSIATAASDMQSDVTSHPKRSPSKAKKPKLKMTLIKSPTAGPSGLKNPLKRIASKPNEDAAQEASERCEDDLSQMFEQIHRREPNSNAVGLHPISPPEETNVVKDVCLPVETYVLPWMKVEEPPADTCDKFCTLCSAAHMSLSELKDHLASHATENPLTDCNDSSENILYPKFSTIKHITWRNKAIGSSAKVYSCALCGQYTIYLTDVAWHVNKECSQPTDSTYLVGKQNVDCIECDDCQRKYYDHRDYVRHLKIHASKSEKYFQQLSDPDSVCGENIKLVCNICFNTYKDPNVYEKHMKTHEKVSYEKHIKTHEKVSSYKFVCVTCGKPYLTLTSLKTHLLSHSVEPAECNECGKVFKSDVMLKTHMMQHTKKPPFPCDMCSSGFVLGTSLAEHINQAHKVEDKTFPCKYCGKMMTSKLRLKIHQDGHINKVKVPRQPASHLCSTCGKCFSWKSNLTNHERSVHRKEARAHVCAVCGKTFKYSTALRYHMANHEGIAKYICDTCGLGFCTPRNLRTHMFCHSDLRPFACKMCSSTFKHLRNLQHHRKSVHGVNPVREKAPGTRYPCSICNKNFASLEFQMDHMRIHNNEQPFQCKVCDKRFTHYQGLFQHLRTGHTQVPTDEEQVAKLKKTFQCPECGECFENKSFLIEHKRAVHGQTDEDPNLPSRYVREPIECRHCGKRIWSSKDFIEHVKAEHGVLGEYVFACKHPQCNKCYKNLVGLRQHEYKHHSGVQRKMYPCEVCEKKFTSKAGRDFHADIHTGRRAFTCDVCGKSFRLKASLVEHVLTHTDLMPVTCGVCDRPFRKRSHLITHMRTHTGEKPYACNVCGRAFAQAGDRNKHRSNMHKDLQGDSGMYS